MLISDMNTPEARDTIMAYVEGEDKFCDKNISLVYEHGHWWVTFYDEDEEIDKTFSVIDAEGVGINMIYSEDFGCEVGFDFEEV